ncbi:hypothetical protein N9980_00315 [bacterium]|nr:hypothetical protein [bacterium]
MTTPWEQALGLRSPLFLGPKNQLEAQTPMPEWAAFLIYLGWWLSRIKPGGGTLFCIAVLPTRKCAAALATLGSLFSSAQGALDDMNWEEFLEIPEGAEAYFLLKREKGKLKPFSGKLTTPAGASPRNIDVSGEPLKLSIFPGGFPKYHFRTTPYPTTHRLGRIARVRPVYEGSIPDFDNYWLVSASSISLVVSVAAQWLRDIDGLNILTLGDDGEKTNVMTLKEVLMVGPDATVPGTKVLLHSPGGVTPAGGRFPLAVLDGPAAVRTLPWINARNVLVLIEQPEFDDSVYNEIVGLSSRRDDSLVSNVGDFPAPVPFGAEVSLFGLRGGV